MTRTGLSPAIFLDGDPVEVTENIFPQLIEEAKKAPLRRARYCLHHNHSDGLQEMIIALCRDSYVRPHRHTSKAESIQLLKGELEVVFFDDRGKVDHRISMKPLGEGVTFLYRLSSPRWHTVIVRSEFAVIHEVTEGPFDANLRDCAPWSPEERDSAGVAEFIKRISEKS